MWAISSWERETCAPPLRAQGGADEVAVAGADGMLRLHGAGGEAAGAPRALGVRPAALCFPARGAPPPCPPAGLMPASACYLARQPCGPLRACTYCAVGGPHPHAARP